MKNTLNSFKTAIIVFLFLTLLCGVCYPLAVTFVAQTTFPYEANGSVITVTLKNGEERIFGSELIGQNYEDPKYMFGRVNLGSPSNIAVESDEYKELIASRVAERRKKLNDSGYIEEEKIPQELLTASGSGVDPHISVETAYFQIPVILNFRDDLTEDELTAIIDKYTEGGFLGIFGKKVVNVLLVNLALDGLL